MSQTEIRLIHEADRDSLGRLFLETNAYYHVPAPEPRALERAVDALLAPGDPRCWIALIDGQAAGYVTASILFPPIEGAMFVKELYVAEGRRDAGIGPALLAAAAVSALEEGCVRLDLTTDRSNHGAMRFYPRLGAAEVSTKAFFRFENNALAQLARC